MTALGLCARCGGAATDAQHRLPRSRGGHADSVNLVALCRLCHSWVHANPTLAIEDGWTIPGFMIDGRYVGSDPNYLAHYGDGRRP